MNIVDELLSEEYADLYVERTLQCLDDIANLRVYSFDTDELIEVDSSEEASRIYDEYERDMVMDFNLTEEETRELFNYLGANR